MRYKKVLLALVLILPCFAIWAAYSAFGQSLTNSSDISNTSEGSFLTLDYIKEDADFKSDIGEAVGQVISSYPSADLIAMSLKFEDGLTYNHLANYSYIFDTYRDNDTYLVVNNPMIDSQMSQAFTNDLFDGAKLQKINENYLKINFVQALEIVEKSGGHEFRVDHRDGYSVSMLLTCAKGGILNWQISYAAKDGSPDLNWVVNATSGAI